MFSTFRLFDGRLEVEAVVLEQEPDRREVDATVRVVGREHCATSLAKEGPHLVRHFSDRPNRPPSYESYVCRILPKLRISRTLRVIPDHRDGHRYGFRPTRHDPHSEILVSMGDLEDEGSSREDNL